MASAVGIAVLDAVEKDNCQQRCKTLGTPFMKELEKLRYPIINSFYKANEGVKSIKNLTEMILKLSAMYEEKV